MTDSSVRSNIKGLLEQALVITNNLQKEYQQLGFERIISLQDHIDEKHEGKQVNYAIANNCSRSHINGMVIADKKAVADGGKPKFIVVGDSLYRLAKAGIE